MKKHLFLLLFAIVASICTASAAITVRLDPQSCSSWSTVRLWAWTDNGNIFDQWPGEVISKDADGWYAYTFAESITEVSIIWNNGTAQTVDITGITASTCYALNSTSGTTITVRVVDCPSNPDPEPQTIEHVQIGSLYYNLNGTNRTAEVTYEDYWGENNYAGLTSVNIPSSVTYNSYTYSVTSIGNEAFRYCSSLTSITIPNSVTSVGNDAFCFCSSLTSVTIPNSVTSIGDAAFSNCYSLTSVTIGNSVTSIGNEAFSGCENLTSIYIYDIAIWCTMEVEEYHGGQQHPIFVTSYDLYLNGSLITNLEIPSSNTSIRNHAFYNCKSITSVTIPSSVEDIGFYAFVGCTSLKTIYAESSVPARLHTWDEHPWDVIFPPYENIIFYVPCGSVGSYEDTWGMGYDVGSYESYWEVLGIPRDRFREPELPYKLTCYVNDEEMGSVSYPKSNCGEMSISATPYYGYYFAQWSDGNTETPRAIELTQDTSFTAIFAHKLQVTYIYDGSMGWVGGPYGAEPNSSITIYAEPSRGCYFVKWADGNTDNPRTIEVTKDITMEAIFDYLPTGKCGKDEVLTWTFDAQTKALEITGKGELTDNYTYTYNLESVTIGNEITIIGEYAFDDCYNLKNIIIGSSVKVIESHAFESGSDIDIIITCYSQRPPTVKEGAFYYNLPYSTIIYVPADYLATYKAHDFWGMYDVRPLGAATVETSDVKVTPTETTADVVWPAVSGAATYELVIKDKNGNVICTLIFNANGQLTEIAFGAPARDHSTQASGFSFTVTGLEAGTDYDLTITAKDANGAVIETTTQSFTTADGLNAVDNISTDGVLLRKQLIDGQLLILRDGKTYTVQGQEVR